MQRSGRPSRVAPPSATILRRIGLQSWCALQSRKTGTATNSLAVMPSKQRTQPEANWLAVPDFSPKNVDIPATNCHISGPVRHPK